MQSNIVYQSSGFNIWRMHLEGKQYVLVIL
jgi:hypothetical protein